MLNLTPRALTFGEILDGSFTLYRRNFASFFLVALVPQVPLVLYWLLISGWAAADPSGILMPLASVIVFPYTVFASILVVGALTESVGRAYRGENPEMKEMLRAGLSRWFPVAGAAILAGIMVFWGFIFLIIPGLFLMALLFAVIPSVVLEDRGPIDALSRSRELSRGGRLRILGALFVAWLITFVPIMAVWGVVGVIVGAIALTTGEVSALGGAVHLEGLAQAFSSLVSALTWPFFIGVTVLLYIDRRARTEAPDLEAALDSLQAGD
jgi:hypothetical protein